MIAPLFRVSRAIPTADTPAADALTSAAVKPGGADHQARGSRFSALMYAMLKPPTLDLSEASGDDEDAPRPPMKAHVRPNLAKLMREIDPSARPFASAHAAATQTAPAQSTTATFAGARMAKDAG